MRRIRIGIYMLLAAGMTALWGSCQRDDSPVGETAEVTLRFATRAGGDGTLDPNALPNEGIKTLRVILAKDGEIFRVDRLRDFSGETSPVLEREVKVYDVPLGNITFYVIANEGSIGKEYDTPEAIREDFVEVDGTQKLLLKDESRSFFPQMAGDIAKKGLPMAGMANVEIAESTEAIGITLERAVAKLNLTVENALSEEINVTGIHFGAFASDRIYLYRTLNLDMPAETKYATMKFDTGINIPAGENGNFVCYVYPSRAPRVDGRSSYSLRIETEGGVYGGTDGSLITDNQGVLTQIVRNTQLNIRAIINKDATVTIDYVVTDWTPESVNVPSFK